MPDANGKIDRRTLLEIIGAGGHTVADCGF